MSENRIVQTGLEARQVLENEAYRAAMDALKRQIIDQWKACPVRDKEGQLLLLQLAKLSDKFESILRGYIESGKDASRRIDLRNERTESALKRGLRAVL